MDNPVIQNIVDFGMTSGKNILIAIIVFIIGRKLIKWILKLVDKNSSKSKLDPMVVKFTHSILKFALYIVLVISLIEILGIPTTSFVALLGTAGLTVGLALQGSLSNFAGGVLILVFKPFHVGDYIVACGSEGVVTGIDVFYTKLTTVDNKRVVIPNGSLANSNIVNVTAEKVRRLDIQVGISYGSDIDLAKKTLRDVINNTETVIKDRDINVFVTNLDSSSVVIETRVWLDGADYWPTRWELLEKYKLALDKNGIEIPFNQLTVTMKDNQ